MKIKIEEEKEMSAQEVFDILVKMSENFTKCVVGSVSAQTALDVRDQHHAIEKERPLPCGWAIMHGTFNSQRGYVALIEIQKHNGWFGKVSEMTEQNTFDTL